MRGIVHSTADSKKGMMILAMGIVEQGEGSVASLVLPRSQSVLGASHSQIPLAFAYRYIKAAPTKHQSRVQKAKDHRPLV